MQYRRAKTPGGQTKAEGGGMKPFVERDEIVALLRQAFRVVMERQSSQKTAMLMDTINKDSSSLFDWFLSERLPISL